MIRLILAGLAVLLAVLAFATGQSWLYATAGGTGGVALGLVVYQLWLRHGPKPSSQASRNEDRDALGLSSVRPMTERSDANTSNSASSNGTEAAPPSTQEQKDPRPATAESSSGQKAAQTRDASQGNAGKTAQGAKDSTGSAAQTAKEAVEADETPDPAGDPRVEAFVRALRHSLQAHTVALLVQEEMALEYRIAGLDSAATAVQRSGSFSAPVPLVTARMSHADVTVRSLGDEPRLREALNYYSDDAPSLQHVAVAPIQHAQQSATYFLLADGDADVPLPHQHTKRLLAQGASMLGHLLGYDPTALGPSIPSTDRDSRSGTATAETQESGSSESAAAEDEMVDMTTPSPEVERQGPRPRIEIVAEEMEEAYAAEAPLALALVHLNRADMIAEQGQDTVERAEQLLYETLQEAAPNQRVERFGELTYGVFHRAHVQDVEEWTLTVHRGMLRATGLLKGGVSIGVTVMGQRHETASDFRGEGMEALHEAYKSGAPVIID
ncbi:hypothetical protein CRI93_09315 [Longimonas halophila]|uniref:GGDEF domain-containing protein n=1 Tax=Longimonas halophila TaxID=1469170 RepID=A0A2H3NRZ9_9BACT|nr:hypothetical protein [Longimonas halophila]PEN06471.1 hypothetical protein CRI93_09315 [Longimonas halophila]